MHFSVLFLTAAAASVAQAQVQAWGQCGGQGYAGSTSCVSGYSCVKQDQWYSQCKPGSGGGSGGGGGTPTTTASGGGSTALTCPGNSGKGCGVYQVSGLGANKQKVTSCGGTTFDLAVAMLETEDMSTNYPYGDNKSQDSANFGIFKQNWGMLRVCCSIFKGQAQSSYNNGAVLNSDRCKDVTCAHECANYYGTDKWFAGHRNGASGLANPNTNDITLYKKAVYWIKERIESSSSYKSDNTRFWVDVVAI